MLLLLPEQRTKVLGNICEEAGLFYHIMDCLFEFLDEYSCQFIKICLYFDWLTMYIIFIGLIIQSLLSFKS